MPQGTSSILMIGVSANAVAGFLGTLFMTEKKTSYIFNKYSGCGRNQPCFAKNWCSADGDLGSGFGSCFFFYYAYADSVWLS